MPRGSFSVSALEQNGGNLWTALQNLIDRYYDRQAQHKEFELHSFRIAKLFEFPLEQRPLKLLGLLTPLVAIAWSDGKIGIHEQDAIMRAGEIYGLLTDEEASERLVGSLTSRPTAADIDAGWEAVSRISYALPPDELTVFTSLLYQQVKFVGELGQRLSFGHLSDVQLGPDEEELLHITQDRLAEILTGLATIRSTPSWWN